MVSRGRRFDPRVAAGLLLLSAAWLPGEDVYLSAGVRRSLEMHFDRADLEHSADSWRAIAYMGLEGVTERERDHARIALERRLADWLLGGLALPDFAGLSGELEKRNREFGFILDQGAIVRDETGYPLLRDPGSVQSDLDEWRRAVDAAGEAWFQTWYADAQGQLDGLLTAIDPGQRQLVRSALHERFEMQSARVRREQQRLVTHAYSRLLQLRLRDTRSLRRKAEEHNAAETLNATALQTRLAVDDLRQRLGHSADHDHTATPAQLIVDARRWEESFRSGLEQGLEQWQRAEQRLMHDRLHWESAAQTSYLEAERAWDAAFVKVADSRAAWIDEMTVLFEQGRRRWVEAMSRFERDYQDVISDMTVAVDARSVLLIAELEAQLQNVDRAEEARDLAESNLKVLQSELIRLPDGSHAHGTTADQVARQLEFWNQLLADADRLATGSEAGIRRLRDELTERFAVTAHDAAAREIAQLEARLEMLDARVTAAQAVLHYAQDQSAGRDTEAQTRQRHAVAQSALDAAERRYREQLSLIGRLSDRFENLQQHLHQQTLDLAAEQQTADQASRLYQTHRELWDAGDVAAMQRTLASLKQSVSQWFESDRYQQLLHYIQAAEARRSSDLTAEASEVIAAIVQSDEGEPSQLDQAQARSVAVDALLQAYDPQVSVEQLRLHLLSHGFDVHEPDVEALLSAHHADLHYGTYTGNASRAEAAWQQLRSVATRELQRLRLIVELLQLPEIDDSTVTHSMYLQRMLDSTADRQELTLIREVFEDMWDIVPAWAASVNGERAESLRKTLEALDRDKSDIATRFALLFDTQSLPPHLLWAVQQVVAGSQPSGETWERVRSLVAATVVLLQEVAAGEPTDEAYPLSLLRDRFQSREDQLIRDRQRIRELQTGLQQRQEDGDSYYHGYVLPARQKADAALLRVEQARNAQRTLVDQIERLAGQMSGAHQELEELNRNALSARRELQLAAELMQYAGSGYALPNASPQRVLMQRIAERDHAADVLAAVRLAAADDGKTAVSGIEDEQLSQALRQRLHLVEVRDYLHALSSYAADLERGLERDYAAAVHAIGDAAGQLLIVQDARLLAPDPRAAAGVQLTGFDTMPLEEYLVLAQGYFDVQDTSQWRQRSNEIMVWLAELAQTDQGTLRDFGLAYYHEQLAGHFSGTAAPRITHAASSDRNFTGLLAHSRVRTNVDELLAAEASLAFDRVMEDSRQFVLYRYFTTVMISESVSFDETFILPFIEKDLARIAVQHVEARARSAERRVKRNTGFIRRLFGSKPWRPIRRRRQQMARFVNAGDTERTAFLTLAGSVSGVLGELEQTGERVRSLTLIADGRSAAAQLQRLMQANSATPPVDLGRTIEDARAAGGVGDTQRVDALLVALRSAVDAQLQIADAAVVQRVKALDNRRTEMLRRYAAVADGKAVSTDELQELTEALFAPEAYSPEAYRRNWLDLAFTARAFTRSGMRDRLVLTAAGLFELQQSLLEGWFKSEQQRLALEYDELALRRADWEEVMAELHRVGREEWRRAVGDLSEMRSEWRDSYRDEYSAMDLLWQQKHGLLVQSRRQWIQHAATAGAQTGSQVLARQLGIESGALRARVDSVVIPELTLQTPWKTVDNVLQNTRLPELLRQASAVDAHSRSVGTIIAARIPPLHSATAVRRSAESAAELITEAVYSSAAEVAALQMSRQIDELRTHIERSVATANRTTRKRFADMLEAAGYTARGNEFRRRVVVDRSLLGGEKRQAQRISGYRDFEAPAFDTGVDLRASRLQGLSGTAIQTTVAEAVENLNHYLQLLFGSAVVPVEAGSLDGAFLAIVQQESQRFSASAQYSTHSAMQGLFAYHVGYAPRMRSGDPERVRHGGYGETGRIMLRFMRYEARMAHGMAMLETAAWDVPLWDSSGLPIEAPTVRGVTTLGVSVAATLLGQPWVALALTAANQAAFATLDTTLAGIDAQQAWGRAGRSFAAGAAVTGIGGVFSGFGDHGSGFLELGLGGVSGSGAALGSTWHGSAAVAGTQHFASTVARHAIESPGFNAGDVFGQSAVAGYASAALSAAVGTGLQSKWQLDTRGFSHLNMRRHYNTAELSSLAGAAAGTTLRYAVTGNATLNLVNVADVAALGGWNWKTVPGAPLRHGLVELEIDRRRISRVALGDSGMDVSPTRLAGAAAAVDELFLMKRVQFDIDRAVTIRAGLLETRDRALRVEEARFAGVSPESQTLSEELELVRRIQSRRNVNTLFLGARETYPENYLDRQLSVAVGQQDIGQAEFLLATHFNTQGSFELAYSFYEQGTANAADLFAGEKAFAGTEYRGSPTYEQRLRLFLDHYETAIERAGAAASREALLGSMLIADNRGTGGDRPLLDGAAFTGQLIAENNLRGVGKALAAVEELPQLFAEAVYGGQGGTATARYVAQLGELQAREVFPQDNLYNIFTTGDPAARATASDTVSDNQYAFRAAFRTSGGRSPGATFTHFVADGADYLEVEVAYRDGTLRELARTPIGRSQYEHVQRMVENRGAVSANLAHHNGVQELYQNAGLEHLYWREHDRLDAIAQLSQGYRGLDYFCNLSTNEFSMAYGAPNLQNLGGTQRTANDIHTLLTEGVANANGRFVEVNQTLAASAGRNGLLVIASQPRPHSSGHLAPVVGYEGELDRETRLIVDNIGERNGVMSLHTAFGSGAQIQYFLWVPAN